MLPDLTWPAAVAAIGISATIVTALVQVVLKLYQPQGLESMARREGKADVLAEATAVLTEQVKTLQRDMEEVKIRLGKLIDLTIEGLRKGNEE